MENIWSTNKKTNALVNVLLFLISLNFLHYGQLLLPIICIVLFIDNKYKFKINNSKTFILLILFAISFFAFSYKLGIYSTIGFFLPMVYYIGSNIYEPNEEKIKNIVYILAFGMAGHIVLNFACDLAVRGFSCFKRNSHLDFWVWDEYPTTQTAILYLFMIGIIYYVIIYEKNKKIKNMAIILFAVIGIYEIALGRRTTALMFIISNVIAMLIDVFLLKNTNKKIKSMLYLLLACICLGVIIAIIFHFNIFNMRDQLEKISIIKKFAWFGLDSGRLDIFMNAMKIAPKHMWGGKEISDILGWEIHDLWFDVFDYAGIIPCALLIIYSIHDIFVSYRFYKNKNISIEFKFFVFVLFIGIILQMFFEPILTGSSIFFLCSMLVFTLVERLQIDRI